MVDTDIKTTIDVELKKRNWTLALMKEIFDNMLDVENDYEYTIAALLHHGTNNQDFEDALSEVADTLGYELVEK